MAKQKFGGAGRGLDSLISGASEILSAQRTAPLDTQSTPLVPIESITPNPHQPRRNFRDDDPRLAELSASIKEHGLLQPIVVTRIEQADDHTWSTQKTGGSWLDEEPSTQVRDSAPASGIKYQIIAGERRWRAARMAELSQVPVVIKDVTPQQMLELALIENIQRADLNPIEEALAYQSLQQEFGLTQEMIAKQVGKNRSTIANTMRLLELAPKVRDALVNMPESFTEGHGRALLGISNEEVQVQLMELIVAQRLTVREAEERASRLRAAQDVAEAAQKITHEPRRSAELDSLETHFRDALMVKVDLKCNARGKGTLVLHFNDQDELQSLYSRLVKNEEDV